jgi:hypothetical protein
MASGGGALMKYRMHKRIETKPDGRKIYYYTFEPAETKAMHAHLEASGHLPPTPKEVLERIEAERACREKEMPERAKTHLP